MVDPKRMRDKPVPFRNPLLDLQVAGKPDASTVQGGDLLVLSSAAVQGCQMLCPN
jgi:hypothetical protein